VTRLFTLATSELIRMALAGELGPREVWTALRGAEVLCRNRAGRVVRLGRGC